MRSSTFEPGLVLVVRSFPSAFAVVECDPSYLTAEVVAFAVTVESFSLEVSEGETLCVLSSLSSIDGVLSMIFLVAEPACWPVLVMADVVIAFSVVRRSLPDRSAAVVDRVTRPFSGDDDVSNRVEVV